MADIGISFNYYRPQLKFLKDDKHDGIPSNWNMKDFCEWILDTKSKTAKPGMSVPLNNGEFASLEWRRNDSQFDANHNLYYFRLKKLRSTNIPAISNKDGESKDLVLRDNQFLGEFNLVIFDTSNNICIVQNNFFGLTIGQIQIALTQMRMNWKSDIAENVDPKNPGFVDMAMIPDEEELRKIKNNQIYRKLSVKATDVDALAVQKPNSKLLNQFISLAQSIKGVNFNITIGIAYGSKDASLDKSETNQLIDDIQSLHSDDSNENSKVGMKLKARESIQDQLKEIDVLFPKLMSTTIVNSQRRTIAAEYLYNSFIDQDYFGEGQHYQDRAIKNIVSLN